MVRKVKPSTLLRLVISSFKGFKASSISVNPIYSSRPMKKPNKTDIKRKW